MSRTAYEAGEKLAQLIDPDAIDIEKAEAVLCEDGETVICYFEQAGEILTASFDLQIGEEFNADIALFSVLFAAYLERNPLVVPTIAKG